MANRKPIVSLCGSESGMSAQPQKKMLRKGMKQVLVLLVVLTCGLWVTDANSQNIPREYRGDEDLIARGILDGNLIETNFRNHGELARWNDLPWGIWPRGIGGRHIDGIGINIAGRVPGERQKWPFYGGKSDTLVNPVVLTYRNAGKRLGPDGSLWGWLPLNGFHNETRFNRLGELEPTPALSDDRTSWPSFWPDRLDNPDDPGWSNEWNGFFGRGVFNADLEGFYVIDDYSDLEYSVDPETQQPLSQWGVFYPSPSDSTIGGLALQTKVRIFQWANILAEDTAFILYRITNTGEKDYRYNSSGDEGVFFGQIMDYGLGNEEGDENAAFDALQDVTYGWDQDGIGQHPDGTLYDLGYTGFAFLESPSRAEDGLDNDQDGIIDEQRFGGAGRLLESQLSIESYFNANYDVIAFEAFHGPLSETAAYKAGRWFTGDENLDWVAYDDANQNGAYDSGEFINNDVGRDGKGPFDLNYPGPDDGEADGMPTPGEPNFDELDIGESDQIGLTGFDLNSRPFYESGDNLRDDTWMFDRILNYAQFPLGTPSDAFEADIEPFLLFVSGPVNLSVGATDFFSTAWIFGEDENDFFKNRKTVQNIYDADYNFAQAPFMPTLAAIPGDERVVLTWDTVAVSSFDRFSQTFDFEGFKLYKGSDALLSDARTITNIDGTPTFFEPLARWDLDNGLAGPVTVLEGEGVYDLGSDTGLSYFYVDENVNNGVKYYYALVAYDHGIPDPVSGDPTVDPQENIFNISIDLAGNVLGVSSNAAIVIPRSRPAGYISGDVNEDLSEVTSGLGSGSIFVSVESDADVIPDNPYRVRFYSGEDEYAATDIEVTTEYDIFNAGTNEVMIKRTPLVPTTPMVDGFVVEFDNYRSIPGTIEYNPIQTGWVSNAGSANELVDLDPTVLDGFDTNWFAVVQRDSSGAFFHSQDDFELRFVDPNDSTYTPPRFGFTFLRSPIPVYAYNLGTGEEVELFVQDLDGDRVFGPGDELIISEKFGFQHKFRHRVIFNVPEGETSVAPSSGDVVRITTLKEFQTGDYFQFTLKSAYVDADLAESELDDIAVVPNPYVGGSLLESRSQISGRGERRIEFINLPQVCTISIFNLRGELVNTIEHNSVGSDGSESWDLRTSGKQDIAYGVYIYHIKAPGVGEHVGKFAVVK
ncbi:MAG: hypothetical protein HN774_10170 [Bacteroidetes Order II. Incertae sedis bacterium]|jgi:hypothetical protein|nr:hypothetical protein [Bacteroidetes Order II. bacterium]